jgi:hypothetical protein
MVFDAVEHSSKAWLCRHWQVNMRWQNDLIDMSVSGAADGLPDIALKPTKPDHALCSPFQAVAKRFTGGTDRLHPAEHLHVVARMPADVQRQPCPARNVDHARQQNAVRREVFERKAEFCHGAQERTKTGIAPRLRRKNMMAFPTLPIARRFASVDRHERDRKMRPCLVHFGYIRHQQNTVSPRQVHFGFVTMFCSPSCKCVNTRGNCLSKPRSRCIV